MSAQDLDQILCCPHGCEAERGETCGAATVGPEILAALSAAGWVVATLPTPADQWDSPGYDRDTPPNIIWADGYNAALAVIRETVQ